MSFLLQFVLRNKITPYLIIYYLKCFISGSEMKQVHIEPRICHFRPDQTIINYHFLIAKRMQWCKDSS